MGCCQLCWHCCVTLHYIIDQSHIYLWLTVSQTADNHHHFLTVKPHLTSRCWPCQNEPVDTWGNPVPNTLHCAWRSIQHSAELKTETQMSPGALCRTYLIITESTRLTQLGVPRLRSLIKWGKFVLMLWGLEILHDMKSPQQTVVCQSMQLFY